MSPPRTVLFRPWATERRTASPHSWPSDSLTTEKPVEADEEQPVGPAVAAGLVAVVGQAIHEDEAVGEPGQRVAQGTLGLPLELGGVGQARGDEVGHQLEDVEVGVVEVLRLAGHDPQHAQGLPGPDHRRDGDGADAGPPAGVGVHPGVGLGVPAEERHADPDAETRRGCSSAGGPRSLGIGAQAADGPVDHDASFGDLDGSTVGVGHGLHPVEDDARRPGRPRPPARR